MWFLFTLRVEKGIKQHIIVADNYNDATNDIVEIYKFQKNGMGSNAWIISCFTSDTEIKEI